MNLNHVKKFIFQGASIPEKIQTRIWHYLRQCLKLNSKDNEILIKFKCRNRKSKGLGVHTMESKT